MIWKPFYITCSCGHRNRPHNSPREGVTVVIGKPISSVDLPDDDTEGTALLKERITELDPLRKD